MQFKLVNMNTCVGLDKDVLAKYEKWGFKLEPYYDGVINSNLSIQISSLQELLNLVDTFEGWCGVHIEKEEGDELYTIEIHDIRYDG